MRIYIYNIYIYVNLPFFPSLSFSRSLSPPRSLPPCLHCIYITSLSPSLSLSLRPSPSPSHICYLISLAGNWAAELGQWEAEVEGKPSLD